MAIDRTTFTLLNSKIQLSLSTAKVATETGDSEWLNDALARGLAAYWMLAREASPDAIARSARYITPRNDAVPFWPSELLAVSQQRPETD